MRTLKVLLLCLTLSGIVSAERNNLITNTGLPPIPEQPLAPSNARLVGDKLIPVEQFFSASRCASCHQDVYSAWSQSLHRNAAREPFYRESADILLRTRGIEFTRHCESCHTPIALFSGALTKASGKVAAPFTSLDHEGVSCTVCHSITEARLDGTGSFTIHRPALLVREDGTPVWGNQSDEQILANISEHKRAMMRPLLKQPEFCATCHKVSATPALNGYKQIPGFSAYDEWQQSGASHEVVTPFYQREVRMDCRTCHMPKVASTNDRAAKNGLISSHRWLGANTAAPLFYEQNEQAEMIKSFLQQSVLNIDIFAIQGETDNKLFAPLANGEENSTFLLPGTEITAQVVIANRNAAHSFPPEVRDLYEAWVEFEATDTAGKTLFHSGFVKPDGVLDEGAHVYKTILLDEAGRHITRHQIWLIKSKGYDNAIHAGRSDIARFRFRVPDEDVAAGSITLRARVNYRRFNQEYTNYVLNRQGKQINIPIVQMAETTAKLVIKQPETSTKVKTTLSDPALARRWNDYGIGLMEQNLYGAAAEAFRQASKLSPRDANLLVNAAIAEMRTERFGSQREQWQKAAMLLTQALQLFPSDMRARFYRAILWRGEGKLSEAVDELSAIAQQYPRDRELQRQLGQTLYSLGRFNEAQAALERVLAIDPNDANAYQLLTPIYAHSGIKVAADKANTLYLQWRDDPLTAGVATRFFTTHPGWQDERIRAHIHRDGAALRPVLTGPFAAPDR
ncbi:MAG: tetratricopeptide repeat protein [Acidobacteriota bacterium]